MAMSPGGGSRRAMSEINVTPLVDVMLVLLIIFMVTAPLISQGVEVDLPQTKAQALSGDDKKLVLTLTKDKVIFIGTNATTRFPTSSSRPSCAPTRSSRRKKSCTCTQTVAWSTVSWST